MMEAHKSHPVLTCSFPFSRKSLGTWKRPMFNSGFPSPTVSHLLSHRDQPQHTPNPSLLLGSCHDFHFFVARKRGWVGMLEFSSVPAVEFPWEGQGQRGLGCVGALAWRLGWGCPSSAATKGHPERNFIHPSRAVLHREHPKTHLGEEETQAQVGVEHLEDL